MYTHIQARVCSCRPHFLHTHNRHTQQMGKWELLNHIIVTAIMTDDCIILERKSLSLAPHLYLLRSDYSLSLFLSLSLSVSLVCGWVFVLGSKGDISKVVEENKGTHTYIWQHRLKSKRWKGLCDVAGITLKHLFLLHVLDWHLLIWLRLIKVKYISLCFYRGEK